MPDTRITKDSLKNHFHYRKWIYVIIIAVCYFVTDLIYTMTEYRPPDERKVDFQLVQSGIVDTEAMQAVADAALIEAQQFDPTLEQVEFISLSYSGNAEEDIYGVQRYVVMIAAQEGDVWILSNELFLSLYIEGAVLPLDDYICEGILDVPADAVEEYTLYEPSGQMDEDDNYIIPTSGEKHVYACPASLMPGIERYGYDTQGKCAVIMSYSANPETSAKVLASVIGLLSEDETSSNENIMEATPDNTDEANEASSPEV
ncbi:MAG: hypothetical protein Q4D04_07175 [Clostridia bacterium]|nr:hypothetical protein [Clostridia bacterium]